jgi:hypothetical protein
VSHLQCKYLNYGSFLSLPSLSSSSSWLWKGILKITSFITKGACNRIHRFSSLPIWSSSWIPSLSSFTPSPSPWLSQPFPNLMVSELFLTDPVSHNPAWNIPLLHYLFDEVSIREILKTNFSSHSESKFIWTLSANGLFSSKSAHKMISSLRSSHTHSPFPATNWKHLWKLNLNDRLKLFLWKIAWDIVPSKSRLNSVFPIPQDDLVCPLCNVEEDSLSHLFFRCFFVRISWRLSPWTLDSLKWSALSLADWIKGILTPSSSFGINYVDSHFFQVFAAVLCDMLWFYRNQAVHKGVIPAVSTIAANIKRVALEHFTAWSSKTHPAKEVWSKPPQGFYKINFDTAIQENFSTQAAICRNSKGEIIKAITQVRPPRQSSIWGSSCSPASRWFGHFS